MKALRASRSGVRLAVVERAARAIDPAAEIVWDNTTRAVGDHPDSRLPPDLDHVRRVLARHQPAAVMAFGRQAAETLPLVWDGPLLVVPHPAYRLLTDRLYAAAGRIVAEGFSGRVELVQCRGRYRRVRSAPSPNPTGAHVLA